MGQKIAFASVYNFEPTEDILDKIKTELDDLALRYTQPEVFFDLVNQINERKTEREEFVQQIVDEGSAHMASGNIKCEVKGRVKHYFSIYKKRH